MCDGVSPAAGRVVKWAKRWVGSHIVVSEGGYGLPTLGGGDLWHSGRVSKQSARSLGAAAGLEIPDELGAVGDLFARDIEPKSVEPQQVEVLPPILDRQPALWLRTVSQYRVTVPELWQLHGQPEFWRASAAVQWQAVVLSPSGFVSETGSDRLVKAGSAGGRVKIALPAGLWGAVSVFNGDRVIICANEKNALIYSPMSAPAAAAWVAGLLRGQSENG